MENVIDLLTRRGFIDAVTSEEVREGAQQPLKVYCGFDPTADSLHLGNMVALMGLAWFQRCGHTPVALVGGATGLIGDPSGKSHERPLLDDEALKKNVEGLRRNLEAFLDFDHPTAKPILLNNHDWYSGMSFIEFLRDIGRHFRMGPMLAKESVKTRLNSTEGMSYTEFSYQALQGYDFLHLYRTHGVTVELGGSDQWGNITAGTELVRKLEGTSVHGVTFPLLTRSDGKKFGKSEKGAIWLAPDKVSPYEFYQHLYRVADADVIRLLKMLTFLDLEEIHRIEKEMSASDYQPNTAQKVLAEEVTRIVHGEKGVATALQVTAAAAPGQETALDVETLEAIAADMPSCEEASENVVGVKIIDVMVLCGLQKSKGQARRLIEGGGAYLNNQKVDDVDAVVQNDDLIGGKLLLLAAGKKNKMLIRTRDSLTTG